MKLSKLFITLLIIMLTGCTTMGSVEAVKPGQPVFADIKPGDTINIATTDGHKHQILVKAINQQYVKGDKIEIPLKNIKTIQKEEISGIKTAGAIAGTGAAIWAIGAAVLMYGLFSELDD